MTENPTSLDVGRHYDRIRSLEPLSRLDRNSQDSLISSAQLVNFAEGETVYAEGAKDDFANYLLDGLVEVLWRGRQLRLIDARDRAAVQALDPPGPKRFTVKARRHSTVIRIRRSDLQAKLRSAEFATKVSGLRHDIEGGDSKWAPWKMSMLRSPLLRGLTMPQLREVVAHLERVPVTADQVIIRQDEPGDYYYIIDEGRAVVTRVLPSGGPAVHVADLGIGEAFGEAALITGAARNATVTMRTGGYLLRLEAGDFRTLIQTPLLRPISFADARNMIARGGAWVDVRTSEQFSAGALSEAMNLPLDQLREESSALPRKRQYVVCSDDPGASAVGALLLTQRGFVAAYLAEPMNEAATPENGESDEPRHGERPAHIDDARIAFQAETGGNEPASPRDYAPEGTTPTGATPPMPAAAAGQVEPVPRDLYDDTATGKSLADLIEQMHERHQDLISGDSPAVDQSSAPDSSALDLGSFENEVAKSLPPLHAPPSPVLSLTPDDPVAAAHPLPDPEAPPQPPLDELMKEFETRLRQFAETRLAEEHAEVEALIAARVARVKDAALREIQRQTESMRKRYRAEYAQREAGLRTQYEKLMAFAQRISHQKVDIKRAKRRLEAKLAATDRLQRDIDELRDVLSERLDSTDGPADDQPPESSS